MVIVVYLVLEREGLLRARRLLSYGHELRWCTCCLDSCATDKTAQLAQEGVLLGQAGDLAPLVDVAAGAPLAAEVVAPLGRLNPVVGGRILGRHGGGGTLR